MKGYAGQQYMALEAATEKNIDSRCISAPSEQREVILVPYRRRHEYPTCLNLGWLTRI